MKTQTFSSNVAGENGGALAALNVFYYVGVAFEPFIGTAFIDNSAEVSGGAIYMINCDIWIGFTDVIFESNSAISGSGGAVAAFQTSAMFSRCTFLNNRADGNGGAVETLSGKQEFTSCEFEGNSAGGKTKQKNRVRAGGRVVS